MLGEFPFGEKQSVFGPLAEPIILVPVLTKRGYHNFDFLVDTGADCSMMPKSISEDLGIDLEECPRIKLSGISGKSVSAFLGTIQVRFFSEAVSITCAFAERENTPFLLGRKDIFSLFSVLFDNARKFVKFIPVQPTSHHPN